MRDKYDTSANIEDQFEPGSNGEVLKNLLGITEPEIMGAVEFERLVETEIRVVEELTDDFQFTAQYIYDLHRYWLGDVYGWAGRPRTVNIAKDSVTYCAPEYIDREMTRFEKKILHEYTPCTFDNIPEIAQAMAVVHGEFEIIHPFREGNGRIGRLIVSFMANQAGWTVENLDGHIKAIWRKYIDGLEEAWDGKYSILTAIFEEILYQEME